MSNIRFFYTSIMQCVPSLRCWLNKYVAEYVVYTNRHVGLAYLKNTKSILLTDDHVLILLDLFFLDVSETWQNGTHPVVSSIDLLLYTHTDTNQRGLK